MEWAKLVRAWMTDSESAAWVRERGRRFFTSGKKAKGASADDLEYACAVVDAFYRRQEHFAKRPATTPRPRKVVETEAYLNDPATLASVPGVYSSLSPAERKEWNETAACMRVLHDVNVAMKATPAQPWVYLACATVEKGLAAAGLLEPKRPLRKAKSKRAPRGPRPLTKRQAQVMTEYQRQGQNLQATADALGINRKTVHEHVEAALAKLATATGRAGRSVGAQSLPLDRRGQLDVDDD